MGEIDYEATYKELKEWVLKITPRCETCLRRNDEGKHCEDCNPKGWVCDPAALPVPGREEKDSG